MRLQQEVRHAEPPNSLLVSNNNQINNIDDIFSRNTADKLSPESLSNRIKRGWQHLEESSDVICNNNNNYCPGKNSDLNDNSNVNDNTSLASSPNVSAPFIDGDYRAMSSEDSDSSSDDESSATYSDTSPLLDVSSLCNSDVSLDSDMSEDSSSTSSEDFVDEIADEECDKNNNNDADEDEDDEEMAVPSMQSSWMSFASSASSPSLSCAAQGQVILPDVLPVGKGIEPHADGTAIGDKIPVCFGDNHNLGLNLEKETDSIKTLGDRCLVDVVAKSDVQVGIQVNPLPSRPCKESKPVTIKHGNTYPREARNKRFSKNKDITAWIVNDSFDEHYDDGLNKFCMLDEGVRLNNFTIVNGYKTLSLTELVNRNIDDENETSETTQSRISKVNGPILTNSYQNFERNYSKLPANVHLYCKDNWRIKSEVNKSDVLEKAPVEVENLAPNIFKTPIPKKVDESTTIRESSKSDDSPLIMNESFQQKPVSANSNSNKSMLKECLPLKSSFEKDKPMPFYQCKLKTSEAKKLSRDVLNNPTRDAVDWVALKGHRDSEWIRKRRNDREEIRRKLAMDSDTEDYITEKLNHHRQNGDSFDRLKNTGNLQICFMNEAAKDNFEEDSTKTTLLTTQKSAVASPSTLLIKAEKAPTKPAFPISVTRRQRPKFFFNRPRSWHASKVEDTTGSFPEEDLLTRHSRLQAEAREALAQAKDMARMQMEIERQKKKKSPIADIVGFQFPDGKNLLSYHALVEMNLAQLQVIVNDLHSQIETLNEDLVKFLLNRDDLHMEQDSMLVDIEDLTRYLGLKGSCVSSSSSQISINNSAETLNKPEPVRRSQSVHLKSSLV